MSIYFDSDVAVTPFDLYSSNGLTSETPPSEIASQGEIVLTNFSLETAQLLKQSHFEIYELFKASIHDPIKLQEAYEARLQQLSLIEKAANFFQQFASDALLNYRDSAVHLTFSDDEELPVDFLDASKEPNRITSLSPDVETAAILNIVKDILFKDNLIEKTYKFLNYTYSKYVANIEVYDSPLPSTTQSVALKILSGEHNPFDNPTEVIKLGEGVDGAVFKLTIDHKDYAAKTFQNTDYLGKEYDYLMTFNHPNIVKAVYSDGEVLYMDYIQGAPLSESTSIGDLLKGFTEITDALIYMHDKGFVHRDIHEGNILIRDDKIPKLIDLGNVQPIFGNAVAIDIQIFGEMIERTLANQIDIPLTDPSYAILEKLKTIGDACQNHSIETMRDLQKELVVLLERHLSLT